VPGETCAEPGRERVRLLGQPHQRAGEADRLQDLRHAALVEEVDRHAALAELPADVGLEVREAEHQVRPQLEDPLEVRVEERAHPRLPACLGWTHDEAGDSHHPVPRADQVERLDRLLGQAHHPAGPGRRCGQEGVERHAPEAALESAGRRAVPGLPCSLARPASRLPMLTP